MTDGARTAQLDGRRMARVRRQGRQQQRQQENSMKSAEHYDRHSPSASHVSIADPANEHHQGDVALVECLGDHEGP